MQTEGELISAQDVCRRYGIVDMTLYRWLKDANMDFPRPVVLRRRRYFYASEVQAWERARAGRVVQ
ncbi:AlpA family phage regulatory protein [Pleomorphomonas carboxyditropha]|uniref:Helix-turn-helix domain-containing protein n=1 Tax=Pleomorphomonas carboxyditropha TaxID=2023338 RepID=A0A2G9WQL0_9HYPH|nr:AlpA family phage regulatory protein [Pleomorphomonas carboxyditropha]PIO96592.1 hypothetical protein CJ014_24765 [Pleomorphomonas carboxyditropha]